MKRPDKQQDYLDMMAQQQQLELQLMTYDVLVTPEPKWHPSFSILLEEPHDCYSLNHLIKH
ncbi:MAG: hypothetical protein SVR94_05770 [Pseudomonadota bacterium]|nr:hypothetical protein [Pseudomonadota bacterium]